MPELKSTAKAQFAALCEQLSKADGLPSITTEHIAAVVVRTILIETASDAASDLVPQMWANVPETDKPEVLKANKATRAELLGLIAPFITAASNNDKYARKEKLLPAKADVAQAPEFA